MIQTDALCADWRAIMVSKKDRMTEGTARQIEANNKTRTVWGCHPTEAKAIEG